jgi:hypothetical protein
MDVYFWDCLQTLLWKETISLNDFCMKVDRCRRHSSLTSAMKLVILIYYRSLASFTVGADGIFATDITDITDMTQQPHAPDAAPVRLLPLVLQKFAIIEAHAE